MADSSSIRAGRAYVEIGVSDRLSRGLQLAEKKLHAFGESISSIGRKVAAVGIAALTPLIASTKVFANMGDQIAKASQRTGVSVEALSELGYAAEQSGADLETLETGLRKMQQTLVNAAKGSDSAQQALQSLGLSLSDLRGLKPDQQLKLLADRLAQVRDPAVKAALAIEIFGKTGTRLLPLMADGAAGIEVLQREARQLGLTMSTEDAQAAVIFGDSLSALWRVLKQTSFVIGSTLAKALTGTVQRITSLAVSMNQWLTANRQWVITAAKVAAATVGIGAVLVVLGAVISGAGTVLGTLGSVISGIGGAFGVAAAAIVALVTPIGLAIAAVAALGAYLLYSTSAGGTALDWLGERFSALRDTAVAAFGGIADALAAGDIALAGRILWLSLQLAWQNGVAALQGVWSGLTTFLTQTVADAFYGVQASFEVITNAIQTGWIETTAFLSRTWTRFTAGVQSAWEQAGSWLTDQFLAMRGLFDETFDVAAAQKLNHKQTQTNLQQIDRQSQSALDDTEQVRQQKRQQSDQQHQETMTRIGQESIAVDQAIQQQAQDAGQETQRQLDEARRQFTDALDQAKQKRDSVAPTVPAGLTPAQLDLQGIDEFFRVFQKKISVTGTFSSEAVSRLGGSDQTQARIAVASEKTSQGIRALIELIRQNGIGGAFI